VIVKFGKLGSLAGIVKRLLKFEIEPLDVRWFVPVPIAQETITVVVPLFQSGSPFIKYVLPAVKA
jgi:hypothetical protein